MVIYREGQAKLQHIVSSWNYRKHNDRAGLEKYGRVSLARRDRHALPGSSQCYLFFQRKVTKIFKQILLVRPTAL